jgi:hypothetical protein
MQMKASLFKSAAKGLILGASVFAFAGAAHAATNLNLYGASAQYNFWSHEDCAVLKAAPINCGVCNTYPTADGKSSVAYATGCAAAYSQDDGNSDGKIYFSYTNKASYDGIDAVLGVWDAANNGGAAAPCGANQDQRKVATCLNGACGANATYTCQKVHIGTSDVDASSFTQASSGTLVGPLGGVATNRSFPGTGIDVSTLPKSNHYVVGTYKIQQPETPIAYPFGFYVNPGVTSYRCITSAPSNVNGFCTKETDCGGTNGTTSYCTAQTIDNLSRLQVVALFGAGIADWSDFGVYYPAKPVTLCMRHAGSGTSATLDWGIMEGNGWGNQLYGTLGQGENRAASASPPYIYFNDGTSDLQNCLKWANGSVAGDALAAGEQGGAIGYMDADNGSTADYVAIKFNGVAPSRIAMHDGIYDNFWTINRMYVPAGLLSGQVQIYYQMLTTLGDPNKITNANLGGTRGNYYGSTVELNFPKTSDTAYPYVYSPSSTPATPN